MPIAALDDAAAAAAVRAREIDVLVNLNGYYGLGRQGVFARRPAPVQVNYLGFPGTLGAPYVDYLVADRHVILQEDERHYAERIVRLPDSYQANDDRRAADPHVPAVAEEPGCPRTASCSAASTTATRSCRRSSPSGCAC